MRGKTLISKQVENFQLKLRQQVERVNPDLKQVEHVERKLRHQTERENSMISNGLITSGEKYSIVVNGLTVIREKQRMLKGGSKHESLERISNPALLKKLTEERNDKQISLSPDSIYSDYLRQIRQGPTNVCT